MVGVCDAAHNSKHQTSPISVLHVSPAQHCGEICIEHLLLISRVGPELQRNGASNLPATKNNLEFIRIFT